jgi:hypothetical protein
MEDREPDGELSVFEIRIDGRELIRRAERLVDDGAERERRNVRALDMLRSPERTIGATFGLVAVDAERADEHELLDVGQGRAGVRAERVGADWDAPPVTEVEPFQPAGVLDLRARRLAAQEDRRQSAPRARDERGRDRHQDAGAVAGAAISGDGASVLHPPEPLERSVEDAARCATADVSDKADAAGIAFA